MIERTYDGAFSGPLSELQQRVVACRACERLVEYRERIAQTKRRMYRDWDYWGAPVPGFGDPNGRLLIVGLAPASHGANRTGRMFTGDASADFLVAALYRAGFATQPTSRHRGDGLELIDAYETAVVRCVPPKDKPTAAEQHACRPFLLEEIGLLPQLKAVLALGHVGFDNYLRAQSAHLGSSQRHVFKHGERYDLGPGLPTLFASYHPSPRNTNTGRLTIEAMDKVLANIGEWLGPGRVQGAGA